MRRDKRHDGDSPDDIEGWYRDEDSSSMFETAIDFFLPTISGSPVKAPSRAKKRKVLGLFNHVVNIRTGNNLTYKQLQEPINQISCYKKAKANKITS